MGHSILSVEEPVINIGTNGGKAVFLDTGSSKDLDGVPGHLSWMDFKLVPGKGGRRAAIHFVDFGREE